MTVTDSRSNQGPGILALRHDGFKEIGGSIDARTSILGCVVEGARSEYGHVHIAADEKTGKPKIGDLNGFIYWPPSGTATSRPIGEIACVFPVEVAARQQEVREFGADANVVFDPVKVGGRSFDPTLWAQPVNRVGAVDNFYAQLKTTQPAWMPKAPAGFQGVVIAGREENSQQEIFQSTDPRIVSAQAMPEYSSIVCEIDGVGEASKTRFGRMHSTLIVKQLPDVKGKVPLSTNGEYVAALQLGTCIDGTGRGAFSGSSMDAGLYGQANGANAFLGGAGGGPVTSGFSSGDKHAIAPGWNQGKLSTAALFQMSRRRDAPLDFDDYGEYPPQADYPSPGAAIPVYCSYDDRSFHYALDGRRVPGKWRWWTTSPVVVPLEPPVFGGDVNNRFVTNININININPPAQKPKITRIYQEVGMPSLHFLAIRKKGEQPFDHRFGNPNPAPGGSGDDASPPPQGIPGGNGAGPSTNGTGSLDRIIGSDPDNLPGTGPGSVDRLFGGDPPPTPIGGSGEPSYGLNGRPGAVDGSGVSPVPWIDPTERRRQRAADTLTPEEALPWHAVSPHVGVFHSIGAFANGVVSATFKKDDYYGDAATCNGTVWFTPPEILPDLDAAPSTTSATTLSIYNGLYEGVACGTAAKLGALTPSQTTGTGSDGWYLTSTGASGSVNLEVRYLDASGSARAGTGSHYGHWSPGTDSLYSLGTAAVRWLTLHADNVGALSAPVDALYATAATISGDLSTTGAIVSTRRVTGDTTLDATYDVVFADTDGGVITVTLPASPSNGRRYTIKNTGGSGNNLTIGRNSININGAASDLTLTDGQVKTLVYQTTEKWQTVNS